MEKCPMCGFTDKPVNKTHHAIMNHYINKETKVEAVMNADAKEVIGEKMVGDKKVTATWIRKDVWEASQKPVEEVKVPAKPAAPVKPTPAA